MINYNILQWKCTENSVSFDHHLYLKIMSQFIMTCYLLILYQIFEQSIKLIIKSTSQTWKLSLL